jgi:hypothetical protein
LSGLETLSDTLGTISGYLRFLATTFGLKLIKAYPDLISSAQSAVAAIMSLNPYHQGQVVEAYAEALQWVFAAVAVMAALGC